MVEPVLFATGLRYSKEARAVRTAVYWSQQGARAGVINMSVGSHCGFWCSMDGLDDALEEAANKGIIPIAAAGNDSENVEDNNVVPCKETGVICVGAIGPDKASGAVSNHGSRVDIWAPGEVVKATFTPDTGSAPGTPLPEVADQRCQSFRGRHRRNDESHQPCSYSKSGTRYLASAGDAKF